MSMHMLVCGLNMGEIEANRTHQPRTNPSAQKQSDQNHVQHTGGVWKSGAVLQNCCFAVYVHRLQKTMLGLLT